MTQTHRMTWQRRPLCLYFCDVEPSFVLIVPFVSRPFAMCEAQ